MSSVVTVRHLVGMVITGWPARIWGGLHWRSSTVAGQRIGASVAQVVLDKACRN
jgi:hypothetical protein